MEIRLLETAKEDLREGWTFCFIELDVPPAISCWVVEMAAGVQKTCKILQNRCNHPPVDRFPRIGANLRFLHIRPSIC